MRKFSVCLLTLLILAIANIVGAEDRVERTTLNIIYSNATLNTYYPFNASTAVYATAGSWLELDMLTNSSATTNQVQVERLADWDTNTVKTVGSAPGNWFYNNGNATNNGFLKATTGSNARWISAWADNSTDCSTGKVFFAAASGVETAPQSFFVPVGGWYRIRATGWHAGDYIQTNAANCTNATLRVRKPNA